MVSGGESAGFEMAPVCSLWDSPLHKDEQALVPQQEHAAVVVDEAVKVCHNRVNHTVGQRVLEKNGGST